MRAVVRHCRICGACLIAAVMMAVTLLTPSVARAGGSPGPDYASEAATAAAVLQQWYNPSTGLYRSTSWWQAANAINALVDYSRRTGSREYLSIIHNTFVQAADRPPCARYTVWCTYGHFLDNYYDDDSWWALTWVNAYDLTHDPSYLQMAETMFSYITRGWDGTCGGGLWWNVFQNYKAAIQNELFLRLSAELYQRTDDATYLSWAWREWTWFEHSGMINSSNLVNNGLTSGTCQNDGGTTWTYNQGVILGGLSALWQVTHDRSLVQEADAIANAAIRMLVTANGILTEPCEGTSSGCDGDQTQFKGIFERNLYRLYQISHDPAYRTFIERNANSIWANDRNAQDQLGLHWQGPFDVADASRQSSALDGLNAAIPFVRPPTT